MNSEQLQEIFFVECEEALEAAEAGLAACANGTQDEDTVNAVFRAVHSIKGGAGAFGYSPLQAFTHVFETLLSDVREGTVALAEPLVDLLLRSLDTVSDHVAAAREGREPPADAQLIAELEAAQAANAAPAEPEADTKDVADGDADLDLDALLDDLTRTDETPAANTVADDGEAAAQIVHIRPHAEAMANGSEPLLLLRELAALGGTCIACDQTDLPALADLDLAQGYLGFTFSMPAPATREDVEEIFDFIGDGCSLAFGEDAAMPPVGVLAEKEAAKPVSEESTRDTASAAPAKAVDAANPAKPAAASTAGQSVRIDLAKLDKLIDGVGELVIAQAMLAQRLSNSGLAHVEELAMLDVLVRDIQENAMAFRAQPIDTVFARVPRLLRELSASTGKRVQLEVTGETTELDKTVIERLGEPLTHLIRNAVDHGIEDPETRVAAGKSAEGTLSLSAEHRAGRIMIRIADDGQGINRERVLAKARDKGIVAPDATPAAEEIDNLIFAPGFSTAQEVSNISGRGVGMDVVRQNVKDLGGRITIESTPGEGTAFILALPLTLAISDGMIVQVGDQTLVIPLAHVVESLRPGEAGLKGMGTSRQMLNVRGTFIPVVPLGQAIGAAGAKDDPRDGVLIVVETEHAGQAALLVDAISDQRQFVIKNLDKNFRAIDGVAGATIMGDGQVALILDIDRVVANIALGQPLREAA